MARELTPAAAPPSSSGGYSIVAIVVGFLLIAIAIGIAIFNLNLPYTKLLVYAGVAALFAGIGANAAVKWKLAATGQAFTAGGAAAIAIVLAMGIEKDPPPSLTMTYYINFSDLDGPNVPDDIKAAVQILGEDHQPLGKPKDVTVTRAPGGNALRLTVRDVSVQHSIIIRVHSLKADKHWESAAIRPNEGFMPLNAQPSGGH